MERVSSVFNNKLFPITYNQFIFKEQCIKNLIENNEEIDVCDSAIPVFRKYCNFEFVSIVKYLKAHLALYVLSRPFLRFLRLHE